MEEEVSQEEEEKDNIHEPMVNTAATQELAVKTEADLEKNDVQKSMDNIAATQ